MKQKKQNEKKKKPRRIKFTKFLLRVYPVSSIVRNSIKIIKFIHNMLAPFCLKETKFNTRLTLPTIH